MNLANLLSHVTTPAGSAMVRSSCGKAWRRNRHKSKLICACLLILTSIDYFIFFFAFYYFNFYILLFCYVLIAARHCLRHVFYMILIDTTVMSQIILTFYLFLIIFILPYNYKCYMHVLRIVLFRLRLRLAYIMVSLLSN